MAAKTLSQIAYTADNKRQRRILVQVPLDFYLNMRKGGIAYRQWEAGDKLFQDFTHAQIIPSAMPILEKVRIPSTDPSRASRSQQEAIEAYRQAIDHLGPQRVGTKIVINVSCYGYYLKDFTVPYYTSPAHMMSCLKESLDRLADYYGLPNYPGRDKS